MLLILLSSILIYGFLLVPKHQESWEAVQCIKEGCFYVSEKHSGQIKWVTVHIVRIRLYQEVSQFFRQTGLILLVMGGQLSTCYDAWGTKDMPVQRGFFFQPFWKSSWSHLYCHCLQVDLANELLPHWTAWYLNLLYKNDNLFWHECLSGGSRARALRAPKVIRDHLVNQLR